MNRIGNINLSNVFDSVNTFQSLRSLSTKSKNAKAPLYAQKLKILDDIERYDLLEYG